MARKRADYRPRIADAELAELLAASGAVLVEGARAVGKTATAMQASASQVLLDIDLDAQRMMSIDPAAVLTGDPPRLLDEWQLAPEVWNHVRRAVDERSGRGQFILTGSAVPADDVTRHTGAGRFTRLRMRSMSLFESGHSTGAISLRGLLDGEPQRGYAAPVPIARLAERIAVGGWPAHLGSAADAGHARQPGLSGRHPTYRRLTPRRQVARSRAGRPALAVPGAQPRHAVSVAKLAADVSGNGTAMKADTAAGYLDALERLMVVEHQPAWSPHLRSRTTLRSTPVRHFVDPSLAVAAWVGARHRRRSRPISGSSASCSNPWSSATCASTRRPPTPRCSLSGEGRFGGRCRRRSCRRALGRLRDQAGQPLGGRRRKESAPVGQANGEQRPRPASRPCRHRAQRIRIRARRNRGRRDPHPCPGAVKRRRRN